MREKTDGGQILQSVNAVLRLQSAEEFYKHLEDNDYEVGVELWMLNEERTRNDWYYRNMRDFLDRFAGKPILISYKRGQLGAGHEMDEVRDKDGNVTQSFMSAGAERIVGVLGSVDDIRLETDEKGVEWVVGKGKIFGFYAPELAKRLLGDTGSDKSEMRVSIETMIKQMQVIDDAEIYTDWTVLGVTILGDNVTEAVAGANIRALAAIGEEKIKEITLRVASAHTKKPDDQQKQNQKQDKTATQQTKRSNRMKIQDIQGKFKGCTVLAVNNGFAAMLDENGSACVASVTEDGENVVCGELVKANAVVAFANGAETVAEVPFEAVNSAVKSFAEKISTLEAALNASKEEASNAAETIAKMQAAEKARRKEAVKQVVKTRLAELISRNEGIDEHICDDMLTEESLEEYSEMCKNGEWCGDKAANTEVCARCMNAVDTAAKKKADNAKKVVVWDTLGGDNGKSSDTTSAFDRLSKTNK